MIRSLELKLFLLLGIFSFIVGVQDVSATHAMGGDITYECVGPNQYKMKLKFFRDCNGIPAPTSSSDLRFTYSSASCGVTANGFLSFVPIPDSTEIITPICFAAADRCVTSQGTFGIEKYIYEVTLDLSNWAGCGDDWLIEWDYCCRNNAITSLVNSGAKQMYLKTTIDNTVTCDPAAGINQFSNRSPIFNNDPTPFGCVLQEMQYNHGVSDPDGDSLVFSLAQSRGQFGSPLPYETGYTVNQPILTTTGVLINPKNGQLTFTPSAQQVAVVTVLVEEYRNGTKINELIRDVQFSIIPCSNILPTVSGFDGTSNFDVDICAGASYCFDFISSDPDGGDSLTLIYNNGIPGATFTATNGLVKKPVGTLCWSPTINDVGPHIFTITVKDNACDLNGVNTFGFNVQVLSAEPADAGADIDICSLPANSATLNGNFSNSAQNTLWSLISGSGSITNPNDTTTTVTGLDIGLNEFEWLLDFGICGSFKDTVAVIAYDGTVAAADAGPDQLNVCLPSADLSMAASLVNSPGTGSWAIISGAGTFADNNDPNTLVTNMNTTSDNIYEWTVENGACGTTSDQVTISFNASCINNPPVVPDTIFTTVPEDSLIQICIPIADPDGDTVSITSTTGPNNGDITIDSDSCFTYTPDSNYNGMDTITIILCDGGPFPMCDTTIIIITVTPVNDAPDAVDDIASVPQDSSVVINVLNNDTDVDGDDLTVSIGDDPNNGTVILNPDGTITYTPDPGFDGIDTFTYVLCDDGVPILCDTATVIVNVANVNDPPVIVDTLGNPIDTLYVSVPEDSMIQICLDVIDPDGDPTGITSISTPNNGTVTQDSALCLTYTPDSNFNGNDTIVVIVCDDGLPPMCDTLVIIITVTPVNDAPIAVNDNVNIPEDSSVVINVLNNDTDIDGDSLNVTIGDNPNNGTVILNPDGTITYTPDPNYNGTDSFTYILCDNGMPILCDTATVFVNIDSVNNPPEIVDTNGNPIDTVFVTIPEDSTFTLCIEVTDPDGDTVTTANDTFSTTNGTVLIDTFCITYEPDSNYNGNDTIVIIYCDPNNACDTLIIIVTITPVNDAPDAVDDVAIVPEDSSVVINVLNNDTDVDGDSLSVSIGDDPNNGTVILNPDGTITYIPDPGFNGVDTFTYVLCDDGMPVLCDTANVVINVTSENDPPVIVDTMGNPIDTVVITIPEDSTFTICVQVIDPDGGDTISTPMDTFSTPNGEVTIDSFWITYDPDTNFVGSDTIEVVFCDPMDACDTLIIIVVVTPVNDAPVAVDDSVSVLEDSSIVIDVISNDFDVDGDTLSIEGVNIQPTNGSAEIVAGTNDILYTPDSNFCGIDSFQYTVVDPSGAEAMAWVYIEVICVNDPIVAVDDFATVVQGDLVEIPILDNDFDIDGNIDTMSITIVDPPLHGMVIITEDGTIIYVPTDDNFMGIDSFTYVVCDDGTPLPGTCDTATVYVNVVIPNMPPVAVDDLTSVLEDSSVVIVVWTNDTDPEGNLDTTSVIIITQPTLGTLVIDSITGHITYIPGPNFNGTDIFEYVIYDLGEPPLCDTATVTIIIIPVNDAPVVNDDYDTTVINTPIEIEPLVNDVDEDGNLVWPNVEVIGNPNNGTVEVNTYGTLTYTPDDGFVGSDTIVYVACDDGFPLPEECDTGYIIIEVEFEGCYIPLGFSPNDDGINDVFEIPCIDLYPEAELYIYNRWGDEVYTSDGPYLNDWKGTNKDEQPLPDGNYYFIVDFKVDGKEPFASYMVIMR